MQGLPPSKCRLVSYYDHAHLYLCRRPLAATLRAQIAAEAEADATEKSAMPSYGTTVR